MRLARAHVDGGVLRRLGKEPKAWVALSAAQVPAALAARLADDGRVVAGLLLRQVTRLASGRKVAGQINLQPVEDLGIPVLTAFAAPKRWTFA